MPATAFVDSEAPAYIPGGLGELFDSSSYRRFDRPFVEVDARDLAARIREVSPSGWGVVWNVYRDDRTAVSAARALVFAARDGRVFCYGGGRDGGSFAAGGVLATYPAASRVAAEVAVTESRMLAAALDGYTCPGGTLDARAVSGHARMLAEADEFRAKGWPVPSWMTERPECLPQPA